MQSPTSAAIYRLSIAFILFFFSHLLTAQGIKIHERVEINPYRPKAQNQIASSSSPATVHMELTTGTDGTIRIGQDYGCGMGTLIYGHGTVSYDACTYGLWCYQADCTGDGAIIPFHFKATIGSTVIFEDQGVWELTGCGGSYTGNCSVIQNPFRTLDVSAYGTDNKVCEGGQSPIYLQVNKLPECSNDDYYFPAVDQVTVSVIHGQELGRLNLNNVIADGNSLSFFLHDNDYNYLYFMVHDTLPQGFFSDSVTLQINAGSINKTISFNVYACSRGTSFGLWSQNPKMLVRTTNLLGVDPIMDNTSTIVWDKNIDPVTFSIVSGSEFGGFAMNGEKQQGMSITLAGSQLDGLSFMAADSLPAGVMEGPVTIQAQSKGIIKTVSFVVQSTAKLKLTLDISPASIEYGNLTYARAQTVNIEDESPEAPPDDVTYTFALTGGSQFARFWTYSGGGGSSSSISQGKNGDSSAHLSLHQRQANVQVKNPILGMKQMQHTIAQGKSEISSTHLSFNQNQANVQVKNPILSMKQTPYITTAKTAGTLATTGIADDGGPDILKGVIQYGGYGYAIPQATDQEPVNPDGEIVQVTVSASDVNIAPTNANFRVMPPTIKVTINPSTIKQGEHAAVTVQKRNASGVYENLPVDANVEFDITKGSSAGQLSSQDGSQTGASIYGQFQSAVFTAIVDTSLPDNNPVQISVYTEYGNGLGKLVVTKEKNVAGCIGVKFATSKLSIRDTTTLQFVYIETNQPVPADKLLDVSLLIGDGSNGYLLPSSGVPNVTLNGFIQPIQYIAPDSLQGDSLLVYIRAAASDASGTGGDASASLKGTSLSKATEKITNVVLKSIKGPKGKIIQPQSLSHAMIKALAEPACMEGPSGEVDGPKLVILDLPDDQKVQKITGTNPPTMPKPVIKAQLKNYQNDQDGTVYFKWKITVKWTSAEGNGIWDTPKDQNESYSNKKEIKSENSQEVDI